MNFIAWLIVACEVAFWLVIAAGLIFRYLLKLERIGLIFLLMTPIVDLILLVVTSVDLYNGATATMAHALAAIYISVSLIFGKSLIRWADDHFRYYIAKQGNPPEKRYGYAYARHYLKSWLRHLLAYALGSACLLLIVRLIADPERTAALQQAASFWTIVVGIDLLITITYFIWPKPETKSKQNTIR